MKYLDCISLEDGKLLLDGECRSDEGGRHSKVDVVVVVSNRQVRQNEDSEDVRRHRKRVTLEVLVDDWGEDSEEIVQLSLQE